MSAPAGAVRPDAGTGGSPVHRLDARAKVASLIGVTLVAVSTPLTRWPVWVLCAAVLAATAALAGLGPRTVWRRARAVLPLVLLAAAFLPFVRAGDALIRLGPLELTDSGLEAFAAVAAKATLGTLAAVVLAASTPVPAILQALRAFRVPRLFVLVAQVTWRYLPVVGGEVRRTRAALAARGYQPRSALQAQAVGRAAGALFLRAHARGERLHLAMLARGYAGELPGTPAPGIGAAERAFALATLGLVLLARVTAEVAR